MKTKTQTIRTPETRLTELFSIAVGFWARANRPPNNSPYKELSSEAKQEIEGIISTESQENPEGLFIHSMTAPLKEDTAGLAAKRAIRKIFTIDRIAGVLQCAHDYKTLSGLFEDQNLTRAHADGFRKLGANNLAELCPINGS